MPSTQDLRRKITSVKATAKLTRAMQMVAASKMSRAVQAATASRAYADTAWTVLGDLAARTGGAHPLFVVREAGKIALVIVASNRGLAGSFNSQVFRAALSAITPDTELITVGRKALGYLRRFRGDQLVADFPASDATPRTTDASSITQFLTERFLRGEYRAVFVAYNKFESTLASRPVVEQLLPVVPTAPDEATSAALAEFAVEPSPVAVLDALVRRVVPLRFYQMLLDSSASEHSARMVAMKSATDNAGEIVDDLTLTYQGVRQANITREIIEVSSGAAALAG
ncbi:MAG: ATP synthase F1 subunit gamma [Patescibacteria group bacterium]|jgi:F-type H+-transporting ATPase subunit gamma